MTDIPERLLRHLNNPESSWSMGAYGAIGEFFQGAGEALHTGSADDLTCITPRGGIRLELRDDIGVCAFEKHDTRDDSSQHHTALCLPKEQSGMSAASELIERGADELALKEEDRDAVLFDLGVSALGSGCTQVDFCVRSADPDLIGFCREHSGTNIFGHGSPVLPRLLEAQPHRVVITRLGRIEVYQVIGGEHTGGKTPEGPHTHLLPELLATNRTHSADMPIRDGWVACAFLYSNTPVFSEPGQAHA
ncbi:MAG: hypothetical protein ACE5KS_05515 [Woeseiaceae bacterium]